jgi:hypothetical protein
MAAGGAMAATEMRGADVTAARKVTATTAADVAATATTDVAATPTATTMGLCECGGRTDQ